MGQRKHMQSELATDHFNGALFALIAARKDQTFPSMPQACRSPSFDPPAGCRSHFIRILIGCVAEIMCPPPRMSELQTSTNRRITDGDLLFHARLLGTLGREF